MNIDKVYICYIYRMDDIVTEDINVTVDKGDGVNIDTILCTKRKTTFVKKALVYFSVLKRCFIDLETKEKYNLGFAECVKGDLFVYTDKDKIYGSELMNSKKKIFSKKRILKKYDEFKDGDQSI